MLNHGEDVTITPLRKKQKLLLNKQLLKIQEEQLLKIQEEQQQEIDNERFKIDPTFKPLKPTPLSTPTSTHTYTPEKINLNNKDKKNLDNILKQFKPLNLSKNNLKKKKTVTFGNDKVTYFNKKLIPTKNIS